MKSFAKWLQSDGLHSPSLVNSLGTCQFSFGATLFALVLTPSRPPQFEVIQVSFTQDATTKSVLENVKLQSSHNPNSLSASAVGLCRPGGSEFVNSFAIKKYEVQQNEVRRMLGVACNAGCLKTMMQ